MAERLVVRLVATLEAIPAMARFSARWSKHWQAYALRRRSSFAGVRAFAVWGRRYAVRGFATYV